MATDEGMREHPYDGRLRIHGKADGWTRDYPAEGSREDMLLRRAIMMVGRADEYIEDPTTPFDPYELAGLRLDGWVPLKTGYEFCFRVDKDSPYVVSFFPHDPEGLVFDWTIEHWEV